MFHRKHSDSSNGSYNHKNVVHVEYRNGQVNHYYFATDQTRRQFEQWLEQNPEVARYWDRLSVWQARKVEGFDPQWM